MLFLHLSDIFFASGIAQKSFLWYNIITYIYLETACRKEEYALYHGIDVYTPHDPIAEAADNSSVEAALRLPKLIDNALITEDTRSVSMADIPTSVLFRCPGMRFVTHIGLASEEIAESGNLRSLRKFANELANAACGAVYDPATDSVFPGNTTGSYVFPTVGSYTPMLTIACHYLPTAPFSKHADEFVSMLEKNLPSALPHTYGSEDRTSFDLSVCGRHHFINFIKSEPAPVWYPHYPVTHVLISDATRPADAEGFRASRIALTVPVAVYEYDEWRFALRNVLGGMMHIFNGFFGQIVSSEKLGIAAWWWRGLPCETGYMFALGEPYLSLIPYDSAVRNLSDDPGYALFEQNSAPMIPKTLISFPKKQWRVMQSPRDAFGIAADIPFVQ